MSDRSKGKCLYQALEAASLLEYGSVILADFVQAVIDIQYPETATKKEFDSLALAELSAIDYVRNILLSQGKYLTFSQGNYRILLPSENKKQVEQYLQSADKKLNRAMKLHRSTPGVDNVKHDYQAEVRLVMKQETIKNMMI